MTDEPTGLPALRASDTDREHTAEALRHAAGEGRLTVEELDERLNQAFAARTRAELELLVADVVPSGTAGARPLGVPEHRVPVRSEAGGARWILSILSGTERRGRWRLAERATTVNFWGGSDLDLNHVELSAARTELRVITIMGGADLHLPDGLNVEVSELAIMGGNEVRLGEQRPDPGGPVLHIRLFTVMGGASVRRGRRLTKDERRAQRRAQRLGPPPPPRPPGS